jgi:hypothetical protein
VSKSKRIGRITDLLFALLIVAGMVVAVTLFLPQQPQQGQGNCRSNWVAKDESAPFEYDGDQIITKVIIKSGANCITFGGNGDNGCYRVSGIGSTSVKVWRIGEAGPECQEISHVEFYAEQVEETATPTRTETNVPPTITPTSTTDPTPTETATTPFKFWTPTPTTPTPSGTPENTVTPTQSTGTPSVSESPTPNGTGTEPPDKRRSPTPPVLLPQTGFFEPNGETVDYEAVFAILFFIIVVGGVLIVQLKYEKDKE